MIKYIYFFALILVLMSSTNAQTLASRISNARVEGNEFKWDIEIKRVDDWGTGGGNDILGNCDFYFYININGFTTDNPIISNIHSAISGNSNYSFAAGRSGGGEQCYIALTYDSFGGGSNWYPPLDSWELLYTATLVIDDPLQNSGLAWHETSTGFSRGNGQPLVADLSVDGIVDISLADPSALDGEYKTEITKDFKLYQNYPNPFNPSTYIIVDIPSSFVSGTKIEVAIFDRTGASVKTLYSGEVSKGRFKLTWDGRSNNGSRLSSGLYFLKLSSKNYVHTIKMTMVK